MFASTSQGGPHRTLTIKPATGHERPPNRGINKQSLALQTRFMSALRNLLPYCLLRNAATNCGMRDAIFIGMNMTLIWSWFFLHAR